jgi:hypothetical protein
MDFWRPHWGQLITAVLSGLTYALDILSCDMGASFGLTDIYQNPRKIFAFPYLVNMNQEIGYRD